MERSYSSVAFWVGGILAGCLLLFLLIPIWAVLAAVPWPRLGAIILSPMLWQAFLLSGWTSLVAVIVVCVTGTPLAYWLAFRSMPGRTLIDSLLMLPIVLPPAVAGLGLLLAFGRTAPIGRLLDQLDIQISFTSWAVVAAQIFVSAPFYIRAAHGAFAAIDRTLLMASRALGVSAGATFVRTTLPLAARGLAGGLVVAWARAVGEFGATLMFAGSLEGRTRTLPLLILSGLEQGLDVAVVAGAALILTALATLTALHVAGRGLPG